MYAAKGNLIFNRGGLGREAEMRLGGVPLVPLVDGTPLITALPLVDKECSVGAELLTIMGGSLLSPLVASLALPSIILTTYLFSSSFGLERFSGF